MVVPTIGPPCSSFTAADLPRPVLNNFERQARLVADADMTGIVVEYRVTAEGTTRADAIGDGQDALAALLDDRLGLRVDQDRIAVAGASAGGALAVEASGGSTAIVLFIPAVGASSASFVSGQPTIAFHSREDTIVEFDSVQSFCDATSAPTRTSRTHSPIIRSAILGFLCSSCWSQGRLCILNFGVCEPTW